MTLCFVHYVEINSKIKWCVLEMIYYSYSEMFSIMFKDFEK